MEEAKATVTAFLEERGEGNFIRHNQRLKVEYLRGVGSVTPKVIIAVETTEDSKPRSYRTDNPERLRDIIKSLIKCLHQLEQDLKR